MALCVRVLVEGGAFRFRNQVVPLDAGLRLRNGGVRAETQGHDLLRANGELVLRTAAQQWSIKVLPFDLRAKAQPIGILTLKNRTLSRVAQVFIEELRVVAKEVPAAASTAKD